MASEQAALPVRPIERLLELAAQGCAMFAGLVMLAVFLATDLVIYLYFRTQGLMPARPAPRSTSTTRSAADP